MELRPGMLMKSFVLAMVLAAFVGAVSGAAHAQQYPSQDIRLVCAFLRAAGPT